RGQLADESIAAALPEDHGHCTVLAQLRAVDHQRRCTAWWHGERGDEDVGPSAILDEGRGPAHQGDHAAVDRLHGAAVAVAEDAGSEALVARLPGVTI